MADQGQVVNCDVDFDTSSVKGKTALVTGGADGIGRAHIRALHKAGASVVVADLDETRGNELVSELGSAALFVKCDVTIWQDQVKMFKEAVAFSPAKRIDIVVANAGVGGNDSITSTDLTREEPEEPKMMITKVNYIGVLYTTHLALHHFRRQNEASKGQTIDHLLVMGGSLAGYVDLAGSVEYGGSKYALRALKNNLRHTEGKNNIRVNNIAPWFIATAIMAYAAAQRSRVDFASAEDAAQAVLRMAADQSVSGRTFAIVPRSYAPRGYVDLDMDELKPSTISFDLQEHVHAALRRSMLPAT